MTPNNQENMNKENCPIHTNPRNSTSGICTCHTPTPTNQDSWEERFDKAINNVKKTEANQYCSLCDMCIEDIKSFIKTEIEKARMEGIDFGLTEGARVASDIIDRNEKTLNEALSAQNKKLNEYFEKKLNEELDAQKERLVAELETLKKPYDLEMMAAIVRADDHKPHAEICIEILDQAIKLVKEI